MSVIEHWQINVCPICHKQTTRSGCAGTPSEPHEMVKAEMVDVVRASTTEGAVEAFKEIVADFEDGEATMEQSAQMMYAAAREWLTANRVGGQ